MRPVTLVAFLALECDGRMRLECEKKEHFGSFLLRNGTGSPDPVYQKQDA